MEKFQAHGMAFGDRCLKAAEALVLWSLLAKLPVGELKVEERVRYKNMFFILFSDPLQLGIEALLSDPTNLGKVLGLVRSMYGDDATDFALNVAARQ